MIISKSPAEYCFFKYSCHALKYLSLNIILELRYSPLKLLSYLSMKCWGYFVGESCRCENLVYANSSIIITTTIVIAYSQHCYEFWLSMQRDLTRNPYLFRNLSGFSLVP